MAPIGDLRDLLRRKWYVDERLRVLMLEKKELSGGELPADKREQSKRRAYVKFRRAALLEEIESFRAESKRVNAKLKGRPEPEQAA